ncbi:MAG TPA: hypothetical protein DCX49_07225 [Flavobacteriales bacterium]|nr:hypothetical protein [Flavobacteriales bacterium]
MNTTKWQASLMPVLQERLAARECASNGGVLFSFTGAVDADMIPHLIPMVERSLNHSGGSRKEVKRVMNVVIESVQNVLHHGYIDDEGEILLYLTVEQTPLGFQVHCGNLMEQEACDVLCDRVAEVNGMDRALLRKTYIDVLCAGEADALRGNAGLGLISMAKRAAGPLEYLVENHSECGLQLFTLTTTIKR